MVNGWTRKGGNLLCSRMSFERINEKPLTAPSLPKSFIWHGMRNCFVKEFDDC